MRGCQQFPWQRLNILTIIKTPIRGASTYVEASPTLSCLCLGQELNLHFCPRFIVYVQTDEENGQRGHRIFLCCLLETTTFNSLIRALPRNVEPQWRKGLSVARVRPTSNRCGSPARLAIRRDRPQPASTLLVSRRSFSKPGSEPFSTREKIHVRRARSLGEGTRRSVAVSRLGRPHRDASRSFSRILQVTTTGATVREPDSRSRRAE